MNSVPHGLFFLFFFFFFTQRHVEGFSKYSSSTLVLLSFWIFVQQVGKTIKEKITLHSVISLILLQHSSTLKHQLSKSENLLGSTEQFMNRTASHLVNRKVLLGVVQNGKFLVPLLPHCSSLHDTRIL